MLQTRFELCLAMPSWSAELSPMACLCSWEESSVSCHCDIVAGWAAWVNTLVVALGYTGICKPAELWTEISNCVVLGEESSESDRQTSWQAIRGPEVQVSCDDGCMCDKQNILGIVIKYPILLFSVLCFVQS